MYRCLLVHGFCSRAAITGSNSRAALHTPRSYSDFRTLFFYTGIFAVLTFTSLNIRAVVLVLTSYTVCKQKTSVQFCTRRNDL